MINNKFSIVSLIFYIIAGLLFAFAIWAAVFSFEYISDMAAMGQIVVSENLFNIISFHMQNFGQYVIFAAILFGVGWNIQVVSAPKTEELAVDREDDGPMEVEFEDL